MHARVSAIRTPAPPVRVEGLRPPQALDIGGRLQHNCASQLGRTGDRFVFRLIEKVHRAR